MNLSLSKKRSHPAVQERKLRRIQRSRKDTIHKNNVAVSKLLLLRCTLATRDQQLLIMETCCFVSPKMATIDDLKSGEGGFELKSNGTNG